MRDKYAKSKAINIAVNVIKRGEFANYVNIAQKYRCDRGALLRHMRGLTKSKR
jgi:hypothetical protein